jgi:hypothetical protein
VILGVDRSNQHLTKMIAKWGEPMGELLLAKRAEIEDWCPSGHYPVLVSDK